MSAHQGTGKAAKTSAEKTLGPAHPEKTESANTEADASNPEKSAQDVYQAGFPVVGIGASAGGLEAFVEFFRHTPNDSGMAFILVPHLDPNHPSILTEIIQRNTAMKVFQAADQMPVASDHVYVLPPNREMTIYRGILQLTLPDKPRGQRMPIDTFLRSLADDAGECAVGIIFSGTGTDGSLGLRAISGSGGISVVQEPGSAKYNGMPISAIQTDHANYILPIEKIPDVLISRIRKFVAHPEVRADSMSGSGMNRILMQLRSATGADFSQYKKTTVGRRIQRRMMQHGIEDLEIYARYLKENSEEVQKLFKELLINVTSFFRDPEVFDLLKREVLPTLFKDKPEDYALRIWIAGCATGEEAYSLAILFREYMEEIKQEYQVQIYSTDLDDEVIGKARSGIYPPNIVLDVTPERLRRFFVKEENGYRIKKEIREMVVFAVQNLIKDPPFTKLDLVSCRNVLIYLEPALQNRVINSFHYALKPGGVLMLSASESIGNHNDLFTPLNRKWKFYQTAQAALNHSIVPSAQVWSNKAHTGAIELPKKTRETNFAELTRRMLLQLYAPVSMLTDGKGNILYVHGDTGKFLRPPPGQATLNVIEMARDGLQFDLRSAIQQAQQGTAFGPQELSVKTNGHYEKVTLSVRPLNDPEARQSLLLVSLQELGERSIPIAKKRSSRLSKNNELQRIGNLEQELVYTRENLQATIEEQQASNEELKSINEEMQSTNEELQSTNEEMETSREELQSVNEELLTVNVELQHKIEELANMQNDMKNLLDNIRIATVFLDPYLTIRRFTRDATRIFRLVNSDIGRPLSDIKSNLREENLLVDAATVLESLTPIEREICDLDGQIWYLARLQPYRTVDNVIDGVVMTFTDITARIEAIAVNKARELADNIVNTVREPLLVLDDKLRIVTASLRFHQCFGTSAEQIHGMSLMQLDNGIWNAEKLQTALESVAKKDQSFENLSLDIPLPGQKHSASSRLILNARRISGKVGKSELILLAIQIVPENFS